MALVYDNDQANFNTVADWTTSYTCSGSNRVLYVFYTGRGAAPPTSGATGITYNGVALSLLAQAADGGGFVWCELWRLIAPATGANTLSIDGKLAQRVTTNAISFTGADQTTPEGTPVTAGSTTGSPTLNVSSASGQIVIDGVCIQNDDNTSTLTAGANQNEENTQSTSNGTSNGIRGSCSTEPGGASITMSWTPDVADNWAQIGVNVIPSAAVAAVSNMMLLGAG